MALPRLIPRPVRPVEYRTLHTELVPLTHRELTGEITPKQAARMKEIKETLLRIEALEAQKSSKG